MSVMLDRKANEGLSPADLESLPSKKRPEDRMKLAGYLAGRIVAQNLKKAERDISQQLLRELSVDVSVMVRGALATGAALGAASGLSLARPPRSSGRGRQPRPLRCS